MKRLCSIIVLFSIFSCTAYKDDTKIKFALAAIEENILTTDYTALVKITNVRATTEGNLIAVKYSADVLESHAGGVLKNLVFTEYVEKDEGFDKSSGAVLIVSLCKDSNGSYYLPDIGYEMPAENVLLIKAREVNMLIRNKNLSLSKDKGNYACDY